MAEQYTVKGGDTLSGIAQKYGVQVSDISGYRSGNANLIYPNEVLSINTSKNPTNAPPQFSDTNQAQNYLNSRQNEFYANPANDANFDLPSLDYKDFNLEDALKNIEGLLPTTKAPTAPNLKQEYSNLRDEYNVSALEGQLNDLKGVQETIAAQLRINKFSERNKPVATNVIEGRISEQEYQAQEDYDFVTRQINSVTGQLQTSYSIIQTMMNLTQQDFDNSMVTYNAELDKAYKAITLAQGERDFAFDVAKHKQSIAAANAQVYVNLLTSGNISLDQMSGDQKAMLSKLEVQAGYPIGFFKSIKMDADANIVSTTSNDGQIQVLTRGADGTLSLQTYGTKNSGSGQGSEGFQIAESEFSAALRNVQGSDGYVAPEDYREAAKQWVEATPFSLDEFNKQFGNFVNPQHAQDYILGQKSSDSGYNIVIN